MAYISPKDVIPDKTSIINGVVWHEYLIKNHNINNLALPPMRKNTLGFTVHCSDDLDHVEDDGRNYTASTCNNNMGGVFTTLYIDDLYCWQNLPLESANYTCGDGLTADGGNMNTISVEILMDGTTGTANIKAKDNAARIIAYLLKKYDMTVNNLYTHNYWINKRNGNLGSYDYMCTTVTPTRLCPYFILTDGNDGWDKFRKLVESYLVQLGGKAVLANKDKPVEKKITPVKYIMKSYSTAAVRTDSSKTASIKYRVTKGDYYPVDGTVSVDGVLWLKHKGENLYSMNKDGDYLFRKSANYKECKVNTGGDVLNVREKPSTSAPKMGVLSGNTTVLVFDGKTYKADGYEWVKIVYDNKAGYVAKKYLREV